MALALNVACACPCAVAAPGLLAVEQTRPMPWLSDPNVISDDPVLLLAS